MSTALDHISQVLNLQRKARESNHTYLIGEGLYFPTGRVYGGQVIAQSVLAAAATVPAGRLPNSIHGYFITAGNINQPLKFDVETLRDGRSFSARRINVTQDHGSILTAIASFQESGQDGLEYADPMPADVPDPESLPSVKELMTPYAKYSPFADYYAAKSPFDIRHVTPSVMIAAKPTGGAGNAGASASAGTESTEENPRAGQQMVWMKVDGHIDADPNASGLGGQTTHRALLALGCDQLMLEPIMRRGGVSLTTPGISFASIDHSMWWYRNVDVNNWHLYVQDTPTAGHGRGLGTAKVYSQDGTLVAAIAQEAMVRVPQK